MTKKSSAARKKRSSINRSKKQAKRKVLRSKQKTQIRRLENEQKRLLKQIERFEQIESRLTKEIENITNIKKDEDGAIHKLQTVIYGYKSHESNLQNHIDNTKNMLKDVTRWTNEVDFQIRSNNDLGVNVDGFDERLKIIISETNSKIKEIEKIEKSIGEINKEIGLDVSLIGIIFKTYREGRSHNKKLRRTIKGCIRQVKMVKDNILLLQERIQKIQIYGRNIFGPNTEEYNTRNKSAGRKSIESMKKRGTKYQTYPLNVKISG